MLCEADISGPCRQSIANCSGLAPCDRGFSYDRLQRLVEEDRTPLPSSGTYASQHQSLSWDLDTLGNWSELRRDADEDGDFGDNQGVNHRDGRSHNAANELVSRQVETSGFGPYSSCARLIPGGAAA